MELKDGTIFIWDGSNAKSFFDRFIARAIVKVTGQPASHTAILLNGRRFEQTKTKLWRHGLVITNEPGKADVLMEPISPLTKEQAHRMEKFIYTTYQNRSYNTLKLLVLALVIPLKGFFKKLGWVPFDKPWMGEVCSVMPDEAYKSIGIDLFPGEHEGYTSPGDYLTCVKMKKVEV